MASASAEEQAALVEEVAEPVCVADHNDGVAPESSEPDGEAVNPSDENQRFSPAPLEGEPRRSCAAHGNSGLTEAQVRVMALELFVDELKGLDAVLTFQILDALWGWECVGELKQAKILLDYLIERVEARERKTDLGGDQGAGKAGCPGTDAGK